MENVLLLNCIKTLRLWEKAKGSKRKADRKGLKEAKAWKRKPDAEEYRNRKRKKKDSKEKKKRE